MLGLDFPIWINHNSTYNYVEHPQRPEASSRGVSHSLTLAPSGIQDTEQELTKGSRAF